MPTFNLLLRNEMLHELNKSLYIIDEYHESVKEPRGLVKTGG